MVIKRAHRLAGKPLYKGKSIRSSFFMRRDDFMTLTVLSHEINASKSDALSQLVRKYGRKEIEEARLHRLERNPATGELESAAE